jgi:hypothetical protein
LVLQATGDIWLMAGASTALIASNGMLWRNA